MIVHADQKKLSSTSSFRSRSCSSSSDSDSTDDTELDKVYRLVSTEHDNATGDNVIRITPIFVETSPTDFEKTEDIFEGGPNTGIVQKYELEFFGAFSMKNFVLILSLIFFGARNLDLIGVFGYYWRPLTQKVFGLAIYVTS